MLDREVPVGDRRHRIAQLRQVFDGFRDTEVPDVVGRGFGTQGQVIPHVLFDGAVAAIAADDRIREIEVFDDGFELAAVPLRDLPAEDRREFRRLADRTIRIEQALAERVKSRAPIEDQIVTVLDLREEEPMLPPVAAPVVWKDFTSRNGALFPRVSTSWTD